MNDDITPNTRPSTCLSTSSDPSVEGIVLTPRAPDVSLTCIQYLPTEVHWSALIPGVPLESPPARRRIKMPTRRHIRLAGRHTPEELAAYEQWKLEKPLLRDACMALFKRCSMRRELARARGTKISPKNFQTIQLFEVEDNRSKLSYSEANSHALCLDQLHKDLDTKHFVGHVFVRDTLDAMKHALLEHGQFDARRPESGRLAFFVDAAVSQNDNLTGVAVINKMKGPKWDSPWIARGYRVEKALDQDTAETVAIWQALQIAFAEVLEERASPVKIPCSLAVIYSDSLKALQWIAREKLGCAYVVRGIHERSQEMKKMGVEVHLHWVPGHRNVPGNVLADRVAKRARKPAAKAKTVLTHKEPSGSVPCTLSVIVD